jgi:hypothetical protein
LEAYGWIMGNARCTASKTACRIKAPRQSKIKVSEAAGVAFRSPDVLIGLAKMIVVPTHLPFTARS